MKAWQVHRYGEPEDMTLEEAAVPPPGPGELLIRNRAAGVNFFDVLQIQGKYQAKPQFPFTPGAEAAGVVEQAGPQVEGFRPGDRVLAYLSIGGFAEFARAEARFAAPIPEGMDFAGAAAFPIVYQTSYFALRERGQLREGEWLLVHAGASGVGMAAIQLGKAFGARVIATAGSEAKRAFCREQGADHVIDYANPEWFGAVKEITGGGADVIYDPVGGDIFDLSSKCIASGGRLLVVGFASGRIPSIAANRLLLKNMAAVGVFWGRRISEQPEYFQEAQASLANLCEQGEIRPRVSTSFPLAEAPSALRRITGRQVLGKAVLTMS